MKRSTSIAAGLLIGASALLFTGCLTDDALKRTTSTRGEDASGKALSPVAGPKPTLAVTDFQNQSGWGGRFDLGKNLTTMMESSMYDTRRFTVVSRSALGSVLAEQDLRKSGRAVGAGAKTGAIKTARYIAEGAITEVSDDTQGTGGGVRVPVGNTGVTLGGGYGKAQITAVVKIIDTTTSEIVGKSIIRGKSGKVKVNVGVRGQDFGTDFETFAKTPIGEAAQDVINQAAAFVAEEVYAHAAANPASASATPGKVAMIDGSQVVINRGGLHGSYVGQRYEVRSGGTEIRDPDTGEVIGTSAGTRVAIVEVTSVEPKLSRGNVIEGVLPERGNVVMPMR